MKSCDNCINRHLDRNMPCPTGWVDECPEWGPDKQDKEIKRLKRELHITRIYLLSLRDKAIQISKQKAFYGGEKECPFCGTENNVHHSYADCIIPHINGVDEFIETWEGSS